MTTHGGQGRHGYSLTLKPSVISTAGSVAPMDLTDMARNWTRSIRLQGGFWSGSFTIAKNKRIFSAFDTWLGCHVEERSGGMVTWEGLVYEMELSSGGFVYRTSLDDMYNRVRADYDEPSGGMSETDWATNTLSIARFGTRELAIPVTTTYPEIAERARDMFLAEHGWPWPKVVGICPPDREQLSVVVNGYAFVMDWKYNSGGACWEDCSDPTVWPAGCDSDTPACDVTLDPGTFTYDFANNIWTDPAVDFTNYQTTPPGAPATDIREWAQCCLYVNTDLGQCYMYLGLLNGGINSIDCYSDPALQVPGFNVIPAGGSIGLPLDENYIITHGTSDWLTMIVTTDWTGADGLEVNPGRIDTNRIQVFRYSGNRADIGGERAWESLLRAAGMGDWSYNLWRVWFGPGQRLHFEEIGTTPVAYVLDGRWKADPAGTAINPWQLRPGVGKVLNYRWAPPRNGYWLEDPALFLMDEVTVDSQGNIQPSMAEISQTENLLTWLSALPTGSKSGIGGEGPLPPNWNVEANQPNAWGTGASNLATDYAAEIALYGMEYVTHHGYWSQGAGGYSWIFVPGMNSVGQ